MSLTLAEIPGFNDTPDSAFTSGSPVTQSNMQAMNDNAKFGAVRNEQFWGYYKNGETVTLPESPADGYVYARNELLYSWSLYATGTPPSSALDGTPSAPAMTSGNGGAGQVLGILMNVDQTTGAVTCTVAYYVTNGAQTNTSDGVLMVMVHAQRSR